MRRTRKRDRLEVEIDSGKWANDRQAIETREVIADRRDDFYRQVWSDEQGVTFGKVGKLSDPAMHGPASHRPTEPRNRDGGDETDSLQSSPTPPPTS